MPSTVGREVKIVKKGAFYTECSYNLKRSFVNWYKGFISTLKRYNFEEVGLASGSEYTSLLLMYVPTIVAIYE